MQNKQLKMSDYIVICCSLIAGGVLLVKLIFLTPYIGMADNGDYARIVTSGGISPLDHTFTYEQKYFGYAHHTYAYGAFGLSYASSQAIIVMLAGFIARLWNSNVFDMHVLGAIYSIGLLLILALAVIAARGRRWWLQATIAVCALWIFFDRGYLAYFHSFYGEPVAMLAMLLAIMSMLLLGRGGYESNRLLVILFISAGFLLTSKLQHAPIGLLFACYGVRLYYKRQDVVWKRIIVVGSITMVLLSIAMYSLGPKELKQINLYQSIFYGILKDSPHPVEDLKVLGLSPKYKVLAGTNYFQKDTAIKQDSPELTRDVYSRLGHGDIVRYYILHPSRIVDKLKAAASNAAFIRPYYLGNYEQAAGKARGEMSFTYSSYSEGKKRFLPDSLTFYMGSYSLLALLIAYEWHRRRINPYILEAMLIIGVTGIIAVAVPLIGDGEADLGKHLFMFNVVFDCMVIAFATWGAFAIHEAIHAASRIKKSGMLFSRK